MSSWIDQVRGYWAKPRQAWDYPLFRSLLVDTHSLVRSAPPPILHEFTSISEDELKRTASAIEDRFLAGEYRPSVGTGATTKEILIDLGAQIRLLDQFLRQYSVDQGPPRNPNASWRVAGELVDVFLIPTANQALLKPRSEKQKLFGAFEHRALRHHRILPTKIQEFPITIELADQPRVRPEGPIKFGAALFSELEFEEQKKENGFIVTGVKAARHAEVITETLRRAHKEGCEIVCFPELTIPPERRTQIRNLLTTRPWEKMPKEKSSLAFVVAGSWHVVEGTEFSNSATVFDAYGETVLTHKKLFPYFDHKNGLQEAIQAGNSISVLVDEHYLIAIGICLDFGIRSAANVFAELNVDLALVVSCGNTKTMQGHIDTAHDRDNRFHAQSFVVQQAYPAEADFLGYVLSPYDSSAEGIEKLRRTDEWTKKP